jgi:hypothetical protein
VALGRGTGARTPDLNPHVLRTVQRLRKAVWWGRSSKILQEQSPCLQTPPLRPRPLT